MRPRITLLNPAYTSRMKSTRLAPCFQISHLDVFQLFVLFFSFIELIKDYPFLLIGSLDPYHSYAHKQLYVLVNFTAENGAIEEIFD